MIDVSKVYVRGCVVRSIDISGMQGQVINDYPSAHRDPTDLAIDHGTDSADRVIKVKVDDRFKLFQRHGGV